MSKFWVEAFRVQTMIMGSFGRYLSQTAHDHETACCVGARLSS
jgi:hypothetical protein